MPTDPTPPGQFIDVLPDGEGVARADITPVGSAFWTDFDGDPLAVADAWIEKTIDGDDVETIYGKTHPDARPDWFGLNLTRLPNGGSGESRYAINARVDTTAIPEIATVVLAHTVTDGIRTTQALFWIQKTAAVPVEAVDPTTISGLVIALDAERLTFNDCGATPVGGDGAGNPPVIFGGVALASVSDQGTITVPTGTGDCQVDPDRLQFRVYFYNYTGYKLASNAQIVDPSSGASFFTLASRYGGADRLLYLFEQGDGSTYFNISASLSTEINYHLPDGTNGSFACDLSGQYNLYEGHKLPNGAWEIYVNGVLVGTTPTFVLPAGSERSTIGSKQTRPGDVASRGFVSSCYFFNRFLSGGEIASVRKWYAETRSAQYGFTLPA